MLRRRQFLTILTSKSLSCAGKILATGTFKRVPNLSVFNDFGFQIVLSRRRGANFGDFNFQNRPCHFDFQICSRAQARCKFWRLQLPKVLRTSQFLMLLTFKSLSRAGVVQILPHLQQPILRTRPFLGADFPRQRGHKTIWKNTAFRAIPTRQTLTSHISAVSHLRDHISWLTDLQQQLSV